MYGKVLFSRPLQKEISNESSWNRNFGEIIASIKDMAIDILNTSISQIRTENFELFVSSQPTYHIVLVTDIGYSISNDQIRYFFDRIYDHLKKYSFVLNPTDIKATKKKLEMILDPMVDRITVNTLSQTV